MRPRVNACNWKILVPLVIFLVTLRFLWTGVPPVHPTGLTGDTFWSEKLTDEQEILQKKEKAEVEDHSNFFGRKKPKASSDDPLFDERSKEPKPVPVSKPSRVPTEEPKPVPVPVPVPTEAPKPVPVPVPVPVSVPTEAPKPAPVPQAAPKAVSSNKTWTHKIPRIIHHLHKDESTVSDVDKILSERCKEIHPDWKFEFWSDVRIDAMIKEKFDWYYDKWKSLTPFIKRVDASRYMLMYEFGGVYMDTDVECVKSLEILIRPLPGGAYSGAYPEPMFLMSEPKNKFWLHMLDRIQRTKSEDTWANTGPAGLNKAFDEWVQLHGTGVFLTWYKDESVKTKDPVCESGKGNPWFKMVEKNPLWKESEKPIPDDMRIGFICNELLDPAACDAGKIRPCLNSFCAEKWPDSFTVHHCRSTWRNQVGSRP